MMDMTRMTVVFQKGHKDRMEMFCKYDVDGIPGYEWVWKNRSQGWLKKQDQPEPIIITCLYFIDDKPLSMVATMIQQAMEDIQRDLEKVARHLEHPPEEPDCGFGEECVKQGRMCTPKNEVPTYGGKY